MADPSAKPSGLQKHVLNFDIDNYLNPICPRQRLYLLPTIISRWFGYRAPNSKPQPKLPNLGVWLSALVGGFVGIAIITNVYTHLPLLGEHQAPLVIASFGAAAILEYNTIDSPLSQPRNLIVGHFLSALVGVAITKAFERLPTERFLELRWVAGSLSVGVASFVMGMTKTVHPPAGATALLASTSPEITVLGWWLLPLVLLASTLMCASALIINNLTRRWPLYWWTSADLSAKKPEIEHVKDVEKQMTVDFETDRSSSLSEDGSLSKLESRHIENTSPSGAPAGTLETEVTASEVLPPSPRQRRKSQSSNTALDFRRRSLSLSKTASHAETHEARELEIVITPHTIVLPDWFELNDWERDVLRGFRGKLAKRAAAGNEGSFEQ